MKKLNFMNITSYAENEAINTIYKKCSSPYIKGLITKREAEYIFQKEVMEQFPKIAFDVCTNTDF